MASQHPKKSGSTSNRGFASMDAQKQRAIASKGGQSVPNEKRSFSQNRELAAQAGRKGGQARGAKSRKAAAHDCHNQQTKQADETEACRH